MLQPPKIERYISASLLIHILVFLVSLLLSKSNRIKIPNEVYSVSLETGMKLGGISNVPEKKDFVKPLLEKVEQENKEKDVLNQVEKFTEQEKRQIENLLKEDQSNQKSLSLPTPTPRVLVTPTPKPTPKPAVPKPKPAPKPTPRITPRKEPKTNIEGEYSNVLRQYLGESSRAGGQGIGAARLGGDRGYGGGILKDPEWIRYRDLILESVKKNWFWHDKSSNLRAIVSFNISRDGRIYNVTLKETSGVSSFDQSCVKAVLSTYRLPPPPERFYQDFQLVEIIFIPSEMLGG